MRAEGNAARRTGIRPEQGAWQVGSVSVGTPPVWWGRKRPRGYGGHSIELSRRTQDGEPALWSFRTSLSAGVGCASIFPGQSPHDGANTGAQGGATYDEPRSATRVTLLAPGAEDQCSDQPRRQSHSQTNQGALAGIPYCARRRVGWTLRRPRPKSGGGGNLGAGRRAGAYGGRWAKTGCGSGGGDRGCK